MGLAAILLVSCPDDDPTPSAPPRDDEVVVPKIPAERVRAAALVTFGRAAQLMPGNLQPDHLPSDLAPLILVRDEVTGDWGERTPDGLVVVATPVVVFGQSHAMVDGKRLDQFHYHWWHRPKDGDWAPQGVRITVDENNLPLTWESLSDGSGLHVIYVSERLEARARRRYGDALPGREFVCERAADDTPGIVVARALADGPVPMGPWIYAERPGDIVSIICRCMPSQATGPLERTDYRLRAWEPHDAVERMWAQERPEQPPERRLEGWLRWP